METLKQEAIGAISKLPESADIDDIMYRLYVIDKIKKGQDAVKEGETIAAPLARERVFPPMVVQMIDVGETAGALDTMLSKIADFYDEEVDTAVDGLTALLEPMLMVFLGVIVGFIVVAMYLPIFKMGETI